MSSDKVKLGFLSELIQLVESGACKARLVSFITAKTIESFRATRASTRATNELFAKLIAEAMVSQLMRSPQYGSMLGEE